MGKNHDVEQATLVVAEGKARQRSEVARVEAMVAEIVGLQASITSAFWEIGRILATLRDGALYRVLGYDRFEDLIEARFSFSRPVASRLMTVAGQLPKPEATKLGQERAYAVIAYARAASSAEEVDPVALVRSDAPIVPGKPLSATPVREIMAARRPRAASLEKRKGRAEDVALARGVKKRVSQGGLPRPEVEVRKEKVVVTWTRAQWERFLRGG
ncbi:MAG: hypothetical protein JNJ59_22910 [Deltaproteobacteria bacterium]|nr:hypothetical protein [Deltaproteobacteria bacterium]